MDKKAVLLFLVLFAGFSICGQAKALTAPQVYISDLKINDDAFSAGDEIKGTVVLKNNENYLIPDLSFYFSIIGDKDKKTGAYLSLIDYKKNESSFYLPANGEISKSVSYFLPKNFPGGKFGLKISIINSKGNELAWIYKDVNIKSGGTLIKLSNNWFLEGNKKIPASGILISDKDLTISFDAENQSVSNIAVYSKITIFKQSLRSAIFSEKKEASISFKPKEKNEKKTVILKTGSSGQYFAEVRFYDEKTGDSISNPIFFNWAVPGIGGQILFVSPDKEAYNAGETAKIEVRFSGTEYGLDNAIKFPDEGLIKIKMLDFASGNIIGEAKIDVDFKVGLAKLDIPINKSSSNYKLSAILEKNENILDTYDFIVSSKASLPAPANPSKIAGRNILLIIIGGAVVLAILIIILLFLFLGKRSKPPSASNFIFLILFFSFASLFSLFFAKPIFALETISDGCGVSMDVSVSSPYPNQSFIPSHNNGAYYFSISDFNFKLIIPKATGLFSGPGFDASPPPPPDRWPPAISDGYSYQKGLHLNIYIAKDSAIPTRDCRDRPDGDPDRCTANDVETCNSPPLENFWFFNKSLQKSCNEFIDDFSTYDDNCASVDLIADSEAVAENKYLHLIAQEEFMPTSDDMNNYIFEKNRSLNFSVSDSDMPIDGKLLIYIEISGYLALPKFISEGDIFSKYKTTWFSGVLYQPIIIGSSVPPEASNAQNAASYCNHGPGNGHIGLKWDYNSKSNKNQQSYCIKVVNTADSSDKRIFTADQSLVFDPVKIPQAVGSSGLDVVLDPERANQIDYNAEYNWCVAVKDSDGAWSSNYIEDGECCNSDNGLLIKNPDYPYPYVNFTYSPPYPAEIKKNERVDFSASKSKCYANGEQSCDLDDTAAYLWFFGEDADKDKCSSDNEKEGVFCSYWYKENELHIENATLEITDKDGNSCFASNPVYIGGNPFDIPKWIEIVPFGI